MMESTLYTDPAGTVVSAIARGREGRMGDVGRDEGPSGYPSREWCLIVALIGDRAVGLAERMNSPQQTHEVRLRGLAAPTIGTVSTTYQAT
jgi:hypothetical protein